ncbi:MAG: hypothetical protein MO847_06920 [Candidatus Protistobacter heckmanni]|nr:hypothetical protein [Candidatus Protistobacter heckmanni]
MRKTERARRVGARGDEDLGEQLVRLALGAARAEDEVFEWHAAFAGGAGELDARAQGDQRGHAVGGGRGIAQISAHRAPILHLDAAHFQRTVLEAVEERRQIGLRDVGPDGAGADAPAAVHGGDAAHLGDRAHVEHGRGDRPADPCGVIVRAARENVDGLHIERAQRLRQTRRPQIKLGLAALPLLISWRHCRTI